MPSSSSLRPSLCPPSFPGALSAEVGHRGAKRPSPAFCTLQVLGPERVWSSLPASTGGTCLTHGPWALSVSGPCLAVHRRVWPSSSERGQALGFMLQALSHWRLVQCSRQPAARHRMFHSEQHGAVAGGFSCGALDTSPGSWLGQRLGDAADSLGQDRLAQEPKRGACHLCRGSCRGYKAAVRCGMGLHFSKFF